MASSSSSSAAAAASSAPAFSSASSMTTMAPISSPVQPSPVSASSPASSSVSRQPRFNIPPSLGSSRLFNMPEPFNWNPPTTGYVAPYSAAQFATSAVVTFSTTTTPHAAPSSNVSSQPGGFSLQPSLLTSQP
ncbi:unnamed protein product, partial [Cuscuta epithymum]